MCVTSLLCGPRADLWPFYGFFKRFSLYITMLRNIQNIRICIGKKPNGLRLTLGVGDSRLLMLAQ